MITRSSEGQSELNRNRFSAQYLMLRGLSGVLPLIPPTMGYGMSDGLARLMMFTQVSVQRRLAHNLSRFLGYSLKQAEVKRAASYLLQNYFDLLHWPHHPIHALTARIDMGQTATVMRELISLGKGLILAGAHFGASELGMQAITSLGVFPVTVVERLTPPSVFSLLCSLRSSHGMQVLAVDSDLTALWRTLADGGVLGLALDYDVTGNGKVVSFGAGRARLPIGPVVLAMRTGAPLLPIFAPRLPGGQVRVMLGSVFHWSKRRSKRVLDSAMQEIAGTLQRSLQLDPLQWVLTSDIWV